jgi:hypothetical protein
VLPVGARTFADEDSVLPPDGRHENLAADPVVAANLAALTVYKIS